MNYFLFKLCFDTAVHFGASDSALSLYTSQDHFCADTLFSALCHASKSLYGWAGLEELCRQAASGALLLSDGMPWKGEDLYIPKPCVSGDSSQELPARLRKAVKKLAYIPIRSVPSFADSIHGNGIFNPEDLQTAFGTQEERTMAHIQPGENTVPYQVGLFRFFDDCGLWLIAGCRSEAQGDMLKTLLEAAGLSGIGGKVSSGYGKFQIDDMIYLNEPFDEETEWLLHGLEYRNAKHQLLLTTSLPNAQELQKLLPQAEYRLTRRSGFIQSADYADEPRKKKTQYFLSAGSVLPARFSPVLYCVGEEGKHPAYRFSGPILLGVDL